MSSRSGNDLSQCSCASMVCSREANASVTCSCCCRAPESRSKTLFADGLQQIVERVHLKRPKCEFIMRGNKNNARQRELGVHDGSHHAKAIHARHLHVQENQIGAMLPDRGDRRLAAIGFSHHFHAFFIPKQPQYFTTRRRFVVHDEHAKWRRRTHSTACLGWFEMCSGTRNVTCAPPPVRFVMENCWLFP